jgi:hypothetical protein
MRQVIHIFRKDVRCYRREIVLSITFLTVFVWLAPQQWMTAISRDQTWTMWLSQLPGLVLVGWALLILRVVHAEPLVGDRHFWTTRPYEWKKLLAAKVVFGIVCINVPLLVADLILLRRAGFSIKFSYFPELLYMQFLLLLALMLPVTALAVVTRNVLQGVLAVLGGCLIATSMMVLAWYVLPSQQAVLWSTYPLQIGVLTVAGLSVVLLQYARRRFWLSIVLLAACAATMVSVEIASGYLMSSTRGYTPLIQGQQFPVHIALSQAEPRSFKVLPDDTKQVYLQIPLELSGLEKGSGVRINGAMLEVDGPGDMHWKSKWQHERTVHLWDGNNRGMVYLRMEREFFEKVKSLPVTGYIWLAVAVLREKKATDVVTSEGWFSVPGIGLCEIRPDLPAIVWCRAPLRRPYVVLASVEKSATCGLYPPGSSGIAHGMVWGDDVGPTQYGIDPIDPFQFALLIEGYDYRFGTTRALLCPGTPLTFSVFELVERKRVGFAIREIMLADYVSP